MNEKRCRRCKVVKPVDRFPRRASTKDGYNAWCAKCAKAAQHKTRYGIDADQMEAMLQAQQGCCDICHRPMRKPHIDHDHATGKVRSLLCPGCNIALGHVERPQWLQAAMRYLHRHQQGTV